MSGSTCLDRRSSGIYAIRLVVPSRLRAIVGRNEIHSSTGLRDSNAAKLAGSRILLHWRERFMDLDTHGAAPNPLLVGEGLIRITEAARAIGIPLRMLLGELSNDRAPIYAHAKNWKGWHVAGLDENDRDHDGTFVWNDVEKKGTLQTHSGPLRCHDSTGAIGGLLESDTFAESVFLHSGNVAFFIEPDPYTHPFATRMFLSRPQLSSGSVRRILTNRSSPLFSIKLRTFETICSAT